jgi:chromosome segregation ATPase
MAIYQKLRHDLLRGAVVVRDLPSQSLSERYAKVENLSLGWREGMSNEAVVAHIFSSDKTAEDRGEPGANQAFANGKVHAQPTANNGGPKKPDIASQADALLDLINELKSITERACDAAVRESECAERIEETKGTEVANLQLRLKAKEDALAERDAALREQDEISKRKIQALEIELGEQRAEINVREMEVREKKAKLLDTTARLQDAESKAQEAGTRLQAELTDLRRQLQETQTELQAKEYQLRNADGDLRAKNQDLEVRLQEMENQLQSRDAEVKEKEDLLQAAAAREAEIGKLIARLSEECGKLSAELHEKSLIVAQLEKKQRHFIGDGAVWKKVLGRMKEEAL